MAEKTDTSHMQLPFKPIRIVASISRSCKSFTGRWDLVSSANIATVDSSDMEYGRSFTYTRKRRDPKNDP